MDKIAEYAKSQGWLVGDEVEKAINNVFSYLDTIDLLPFISEYKGSKLYELMDKLEERFPYNDEYSETLFDAVSEDEFVYYLNKKYNLNIRETTVSYYYI